MCYQSDDSEWTREIKRFPAVVIFGTGDSAQSEYGLAVEKGINIEAFIVSDGRAKKDVFCGLPVKYCSDIGEEDKKTIGVIISRAWAYEAESIEMLRKCGFINIFSGVTSGRGAIDSDYASILQHYNNASVYRYKRRYDRELLGDVASQKPVNLKIYVCTSTQQNHTVFLRWDGDFFQYIQGGSALVKERIADLTDDTGDNISVKNPYYNELTAGYWIHKNDLKSDWIGLFHYSRGLALDNGVLKQMEDGCTDVFVAVPSVHKYPVRDAFLYESVKRGMRFLLDRFPYCRDAVDYYLNGHYIFGCNILIAKKEVFHDYYKWLFKFYDEYERFLNQKCLLTEGHLGIMGEHLQNIYFGLRNDLKITFLRGMRLY